MSGALWLDSHKFAGQACGKLGAVGENRGHLPGSPMPRRPPSHKRYTPEIAAAICARLAAGESLRAICRDPGMPAPSTVIDWVLADQDGFAARYDRARQIQAHLLADEIVEIADDSSQDWEEGEGGKPVVSRDAINRSRLRVDTRKWYLTKILPKVYGDKVDVNHGGQADNPFKAVLDLRE